MSSKPVRRAPRTPNLRLRLETLEDRATPTVVSIGPATVTEGGTATFTVSLDAATIQTVTVDYATADGTATAPADYIATFGTVTFAPGETSKPITVTTNDDALIEDDETFRVALSNATQATIGTGTGTGTILDNEAKPTVSISGSPMVMEGAMAMFTVSLSVASGRTITVDFSTSDGTANAPGDYTAASGTVTFAPGETTKPITVATIDDTIFDDGNETFTVTLSNPGNATLGTATATGTITDNDPVPTVSVNDATAFEGGTATFTFSLSSGSDDLITVTYQTADMTAMAPGDYAAASGTLMFMPGETAKTVAVTTASDMLAEGNETFALNITAGVNVGPGDLQGIGTITETSPTVSISGSPAVTEGGTATFNISLAYPSTQTITVGYATADGTATTADNDYLATFGTATFAPGETTKPITVTTTGDTKFEPAETFSVTLSNPTNATIGTGTDTGTIANNDNPPSVSVNDVSVFEGRDAVFTISLSNASFEPITVAFSTAQGTATAPDDYTTATGSVVFAPGQTSKTVAVATVRDTSAEGDQTFFLNLMVTGGTVGSVDNEGTATISDNPPVAPLAVSGPANGQAVVFTANTATGQYPAAPSATLAPFGAIAADVRVAVGDVNADGTPDTILVTGPGVPIRVAVVSGADNSTVLVAPFDPFGGDFTGGGFVAAGDFDHESRAEIIVTPDQGGGPRVSAFSLNPDGSLATRANFFGIDDPNFRGGARVAAGDVNNDGTPDLAVAAGFGGGPRVALFDGTTLFGTPTRLVNDFFAFPEDAATLRNGAFVAAGDVTGDGSADLIFGGGPGGAPRVFILSGALIAAGNIQAAYNSPVANFFVAGNTSDRGGVRVATTDADGDALADVAVGSGEGSPAKVHVYLGKNFTGTGEPADFQEIAVFGGAALADGVYVG